MFTKQEAVQLKKEFWTSFGQYMKPVPSAEGEKINWINYKTGEKDISFKMDTYDKTAIIAIEISHSDKDLQHLYFEQFKELKSMLNASINEEWEWQLHYMDQWGKVTSRIYTTLNGVNVLRRDDWPQLISFFKPRIIALDDFWSNAKYGFEALR